MPRLLAGLLIVGLAAWLGCTEHRVKVEPIEVKPIHVTMDVNIKVDRELDRFFDFEDDIMQDKPDESKKSADAGDATPASGG